MVDDPNILLIGAAKVLSAKMMSLAIGVLGAALSLNVWFISRLVTTQDQIQLALQDQRVSNAVTNAKLEQLDQRVNRIANYMNEMLKRKN